VTHGAAPAPSVATGDMAAAPLPADGAGDGGRTRAMAAPGATTEGALSVARCVDGGPATHGGHHLTPASGLTFASGNANVTGQGAVGVVTTNVLGDSHDTLVGGATGARCERSANG
jgi:hypothetical protein